MRLRTQPFTKSVIGDDTIFTADFSRHVDSWLMAGDISQHSERTITTRRERLGKLQWFLNQ